MAIITDARQLHDRIVSHAGPANYTNVASAYDALQASEAGCKNLYHVEDSITSDGLYYVSAMNPSVGPLGGGAASVTLRWSVVTTGAEVGNGTNLSGSTASLRVLGV
jgi:hypothetical protein